MIAQKMLLAIGYHKTGNSWLDHHLFQNPSSGFIWWLTNQSCTKLIFGPHPLDFDLKKSQEELQKLIPSPLDDKVPVLAMERLSGNLYFGGYDNKEIADRLIDLFPNARILIVIREQKQIILSTYNEYVRASGPCSLKNLVTEQIFPYRSPKFSLDHFAYHRLINYYIKLFGKSNVLVLTYEQFRSDPKSFVSQILAFNEINDNPAFVETLPYDARINPSLSWISTILMQKLNPLIMRRSTTNRSPLLPLNIRSVQLVRLLQNLKKIFPLDIFEPWNLAIKQRLMAEITEVIGDRYQESNAITSELIGIDLSQYNYDLPGDYSFSAHQ